MREYRAETAQTRTRKLMLLAHAEVFEYRALPFASQRAERIAEHLSALEVTRELNTGELQQQLSEAQERNTHCLANSQPAYARYCPKNDITDIFLAETRARFIDLKSPN